jgi:hypothetical protein
MQGEHGEVGLCDCFAVFKVGDSTMEVEYPPRLRKRIES